MDGMRATSEEYPSREIKDPEFRRLMGPSIRVFDWPQPWWYGTEKDQVISFWTSDATYSAVT